MPSERTKEPEPALAAADHLAAMLNADSALYERILDTPVFAYHFNGLAKLATANEHREAVTEKPEAAQMHNYRQNERIAKMQAVVDAARVLLVSPIFDSPTHYNRENLAAALNALDALPSSTEDDTKRIAAIARAEINRRERASYD